MNTLLPTLRILLTLVTLLAWPQLASAQRTFAHVTPSPLSTNVASGVATNLTCIVTVDTAGLGASTRFRGDATITASVSPAEPTITATLNPIVLTNFLNASYTTNTTLTVTTTAGTPVNTYLIRVVANTNPPNANVTPVTNTFTLVVGNAFVPQKTWAPASANLNWSTAANWSATGSPTPSNDVVFVDLGATNAAGNVDNVVDATLNIGSLTYGQTNNFHTTLIPPAVTLTIGATAGGLVVGTGTDPADGQLVNASVTGAGTLLVTNRNASIYVSQSHPTANNGVALAQATLDLSGLNTFTATVARLLVGVDLSLRGASGVLKLAATNSISATPGSAAPQIDVGDNTQASGSPAIPSVLLLGQTNAFFVDSITIGRGKTDNTGPSMAFNGAFVSPTASFRGTNGGRVGTWTIGDGFGSRTTVSYGTCDFSLGTVNALVDTMYVGKGASTAFGTGANDPGFGTVTLNAGVIDLNNLEVGYSLTAAGSGTVNVSGGSLLVNTLLELGHGAGASGALNISGGTVTATTGVIVGGGSASITMTGGTLSATNGNITLGTVANPITSFSVADSTLKVPSRSTSPTVVVTTLTGGGTANTINISTVPVLTNVPAQFPLVQYTFSSGNLDTFVLGTLPGTYQGYVSNNAANSTIDLVLTNGPVTPVLVWDGGVNGNWNTTTANWKTNGVSTTFQQNYPLVQFDDSLTGTTSINLTAPFTIGSGLTINNTLSNYVFTGAGSIGGNIALVKSGSGALTLAETGGDNFTGGINVNDGTLVLANANSAISGGTTISGGTLQIGNNDGNGILPAGAVADGGALLFNRTSNFTVTNPISGSGTITQANTNIVTLSGNSTFAGVATVVQGTLQVGSTNGLGLASSVIVSNGATFDVGGFALFGNGNSALTVVASGSGAGGNGAIVNSGGNQSRVLHLVTLTADTTIGGASDWDIRNSTGSSAPADAELNGAFNLTKVGTNTVSLRGVTVDTGLGTINVTAGGLTFTATATAPLNSLGIASAAATVLADGTLTFDTIGTIPGKNVILSNGGTLKSTGTNTFTSQLTLTGAANNTVTVGNGAQFTITTAIGGAGGLAKNGVSTLFLPAANTYGGSTVISGGTLALYGGGDGSIGSSTNINITSGATLDVSGRSDRTFTLVSGQTLSGGFGTNGPGVLNGILTANLNSIIAPGTTTNTGTLTVSSNATLQGATIMKLNAGAGANDQLGAYNIAYGGSLTVTNLAGAITNGQSFQLFVATNSYSGSFASLTLPSATGLTWTNTLAINGRLTAGVAATTPPQPYLTGVSLSGTSFIINGTNGVAGGPYVVLSSTNVALPLVQWTRVATNTFSGGNFSITNPVTPGVAARFYALQVQ